MTRRLSALPSFPALRALMPMDVPDEGFRHVGRCERLEELWLMYCRDTGDAATERIAGLSGLKTYYAGKTRITDRSLEILWSHAVARKDRVLGVRGDYRCGRRLAGRPSTSESDHRRRIAQCHSQRDGGFSQRRSRELLVNADNCGIVAPKIDVVGYSYVSPKFIGKCSCFDFTCGGATYVGRSDDAC